MKNLTFKDIVAKWKALPAKTKNLVLVLLGVAIFIGAYMLGFQNIQEATTAVNDELATQTEYCNTLKEYYDNLTMYQNTINEDKDIINSTLSRLPLGIENEDLVMYVEKMTESLDIDFTSISFEEPSLIGEFGCMVNGNSVTAQAMCTGATFDTTMNYSQFKKSLQYIYDENSEITFLNSVSLTYDATAANLSANFDISKYYITYDGCNYVPVTIPDVAIGVSDPFGTK